MPRLELGLNTTYVESGAQRAGRSAATNDFISTWETTGSSEKVTLPFVSSGSIDFTIDWGDGGSDTVTAYDDNLGGGGIDHTYSSADTYTITLSGIIRGFKFNNGGDKTKIKSITKWGTFDISTKLAFTGCNALTVSATDAPTISSTDLEETFNGCTVLTGIGDAADEWDVSSVTNMGAMFYASAFNQDINSWDVSEVTEMGSMFANVSEFNQDIGSWDVSKCTNTSSMFNNCTAFNGNIGSWGSKTGAVTNMGYMFFNCDAFNQDIGSWDVSKVTSMSNFLDGSHIFNQDIGGWDVSSVLTMRSTFNACYAFNQDLSDWDTSAVTTMQTMFQGCTIYNQPMATSGDKWDVSNVTTFNSIFAEAVAFNQDIGNWDTSSVTNMEYAFYGCTVFNQDISDWNTAAVTNMSNMFRNTGAFNQDINTRDSLSFDGTNDYVDTGAVTALKALSNSSFTVTAWINPALNSADRMICGTTWTNSGFGFRVNSSNKIRLVLLTNSSNYTAMTTDSALSAGWQFVAGTWDGTDLKIYVNGSAPAQSSDSAGSLSGQTSTTNLYIGNNSHTNKYWDGGIDEVAVFSAALSDADVLDYYNSGTPKDLSDESNLAGYWRFEEGTGTSVADSSSSSNAGTLVNSPTWDSNWDTAAVTNMSGIFNTATAFNGNIGSWDVSSVTGWTESFQGTTVFNQDIGSWDMSATVGTYRMFRSAPAFNQNIGAWDMSSNTYFREMFSSATSFNNGGSDTINNWNVTAGVYMRRMFYATPFNQPIGDWTFRPAGVEMYNMLRLTTAFNQDISDWDISTVSNLTGFLEQNTTFSKANYNALLVAWEADDPVDGLSFHAGDAEYSGAGATARAALIATHNWTITDGGLNTDFISTWGTAGSSEADRTVTLPLVSSGSINFTIDWGDSTAVETITAYDDADRIHIYAAEGTYTVTMVGTIKGFRFNNGGDKTKLKTITQWGTFDISIDAVFYGCSALTVSATDAPTISTTTLYRTFRGCTLFNGVVNEWDVSSVDNMFSVFHDSAFNQDISSWDVSSVNSFRSMFHGSPFNQNISDWNTSTATKLQQMFAFASAYNQPMVTDGSKWDVSNVTIMSEVFNGASAFNQDISSWNTVKVTNMSYMFNSATSFNQDISDWNTAAVTEMADTFRGATAFNQDINTWASLSFDGTDDYIDIAGGAVDLGTTNSISMWIKYRAGETSLAAIPLGYNAWGGGSYTFYPAGTSGSEAMYIRVDGQTVSYTDSTTKSYLALALAGAWQQWGLTRNGDDLTLYINGVDLGTKTLSSSQGNTYIDTIGTGWAAAGSSTQYLSFDGKIDEVALFDAILDDSAMTAIYNSGTPTDLSSEDDLVAYWRMEEGTGASVADSSANSNTGTLENSVAWDSNWDTSAVTTMSGMFNEATAFNGNITSWDVSSVTDMTKMFRKATNFNQNINSWTTSSVTYLQATFSETNFNQPLNDWDTSSVTRMYDVFYNSPNFNQDLSDWDTSSATNLNGMFRSATAYNQDISAWTVAQVTTFDSMFLYNTGMSDTNWSLFLVRLEATSSQSSVPLHGGSARYSGSAATARAALVSNGWTITDGGLAYNAYSLSFDGTNDFVDLRDGGDGSAGFTGPAGLPLGDSPRTIAVWIKPDSLSGIKQLFSYGNAGSGLAVNFRQSTNKLNLDPYATAVTSSVCLIVDTWHLVVAVLDGGTGCKLYRNTTEVADGTLGAALDTELGAYFASIGAYNYNGSTRGGFYSGLMKSMACWDVELDADAITVLYNSGVPIDITSNSGNYDNSSDLVAYWRFNEGTGTTVGETTGTANVYDGTIINGATWSTDIPT